MVRAVEVGEVPAEECAVEAAGVVNLGECHTDEVTADQGGAVEVADAMEFAQERAEEVSRGRRGGGGGPTRRRALPFPFGSWW